MRRGRRGRCLDSCSFARHGGGNVGQAWGRCRFTCGPPPQAAPRPRPTPLGGVGTGLLWAGGSTARPTGRESGGGREGPRRRARHRLAPLRGGLLQHRPLLGDGLVEDLGGARLGDHRCLLRLQCCGPRDRGLAAVPGAPGEPPHRGRRHGPRPGVDLRDGRGGLALLPAALRNRSRQCLSLRGRGIDSDGLRARGGLCPPRRHVRAFHRSVDARDPRHLRANHRGPGGPMGEGDAGADRGAHRDRADGPRSEGRRAPPARAAGRRARGGARGGRRRRGSRGQP